jgi:hypothetical protein
MYKMKRSILILSLFNLFIAANIAAQELNAKVTINHAQIQGTDASVFETLQQALEQFINERQWTALQFQENERINCNFNITVTKYDQSNNRFTCNTLIQANRPVYNSSYTTTLYNNTDITENLNVMLRFCYADKGRTATLTVNGEKIADIAIPAAPEGKDSRGLFNMEYSIPTKMAESSKSFTVRLSAGPDTLCPGLYYIRLMKP